jgi:hypothetical protein
MITIANGSSKLISHLRNIIFITMVIARNTSAIIMIVTADETTLFITFQLQFRPQFFFLCFITSHGYLLYSCGSADSNTHFIDHHRRRKSHEKKSQRGRTW